LDKLKTGTPISRSRVKVKSLRTLRFLTAGPKKSKKEQKRAKKSKKEQKRAKKSKKGDTH
jgi:hypothetical protein